jgi:hypothetical protein
VFNQGSPWRDHSTYWNASDDFVGRLVSSIAEHVDSDVAALLNADRQGASLQPERRRWRVAWLGRARRVAALAALASIVAQWPQWRAVWTSEGLRTVIGESLLRAGAVVAAFVPDWVMPWLVRPLPAELSARAARADTVAAFEGAAFPLALACAGYVLALLLWKGWDWHERETFGAGEPYENFNTWATWFLLAMTFVPIIAVTRALQGTLDRLLDPPAVRVIAGVALVAVLAVPHWLVFRGSRERNA